MDVSLTAVLFDLDGTLVSFKFRVNDAKMDMIREIEKNGVDVSDLTLKSFTQEIIERGAKEVGEFFRARLHEILDRYEIEAAEESNVMPQTFTVLNALRRDGQKMGIVTNSGRRAAEITLARHNLDKWFHAIITRDEVTKIKPVGEGILKALQEMQVPNEEAVYIGDAVIDIKAAKDAGVKSVALLVGSQPRERLIEASPDHTADSLMDALRIVRANVKGKVAD